jgi:hypothetical protein
MQHRTLALAVTALALAACSNQVIIGSGGAGGAETSVASSSSKTSSIATSSSKAASSTSSSVDCMGDQDCIPQGPCAVAFCSNGVCMNSFQANGSPCNDGDLCVTDEACLNGDCVGTPKMCPGMGGCTLGQCDPGTGNCVVVDGNEGSPCDDFDACTGDGVCMSGTCKKGSPLDCSALSSACAVGQCGPMGCFASPINEGGSCSDQLACTVGDHCQMGACVSGAPKTCASANPCQVGACDAQTGNCVFSAGNDGAACTVTGSCQVGMTCSAGTCQGGVGAPLYFYEDFSDNSQGWSLGPEWQIGPTMTSSGQSFGNPDPAQDHTTTGDNGVAGIVIGGNANTAPHAFEYLTSPPFDTSSATGPVSLGFWRWLNSDFDPWMVDVVDVWNGTQWINVFTSTNQAPITDAAWTHFQYDVTAYKNAQMKVRFGLKVGTNQGVFVVGSWNVDDVRVADPACP